MITSNDTGTMITSDPTELMKTPGTRSPETGTGGRNPCWFDFTASFYGWNRLIPFHSQTYFLAVESIHVYPPPKNGGFKAKHFMYAHVTSHFTQQYQQIVGYHQPLMADFPSYKPPFSSGISQPAMFDYRIEGTSIHHYSSL